MGYYTVIRDAGPGWTHGSGAFEQPGAPDHAMFMNGLAEEGFLLFAGPLAGSETSRIRVLLVASAETPAEIHHRLADDPWVKSQRLITTSIESWTPIVGAERLATL